MFVSGLKYTAVIFVPPGVKPLPVSGPVIMTTMFSGPNGVASSDNSFIKIYNASAWPPTNFFKIGSSGKFSSFNVPVVRSTRRILPM